MMQCKEACSISLLTKNLCQLSPLNSSLFNCVICRGKVHLQFTNNWFPPERGSEGEAAWGYGQEIEF